MGAPAELVENFLNDYARSLSAGDSAALVSSFSIPSQILTENGTICVSEPEKIQSFFDADHARRTAAGVVGLRPEHVDIDHLTDSLSVADVRWRGVDAEGNGTAHLEFTLFVLRDSPDGIRVETAVMRNI